MHSGLEMGAKLFVIISLMVLIVQVDGRTQCLEEERKGLLEFKAFMKTNAYNDALKWDADHLLPSWVDDHQEPESHDCCRWERVTCNSTTDHVIDLSLDNIRQLDEYHVYDRYYKERDWYLNLSLFQPFKELRSLNLSSNVIGGFIHNEGYENLLRLDQLEMLDLTINALNQSALQYLSALTSLKKLNLSGNWLERSFPTKELSVFEKLEFLDLSYNQLNSSLPGLCELRRLRYLDLSLNYFEEILPSCLSNLTSLAHLDLSSNKFKWTVSSELVKIPTSIKYIDLSGNQFEGSFFLRSLAKFSKLEVFFLNGDYNIEKLQVLDVGTQEHWDPSFQLEALELSSCNLTNLPKFLVTQQCLRFLDLSNNKLNGNFPNWLLENNSRLEVLSLWKNSFSSRLYLPTYPLRNIIYLDLSDNFLDGLLPKDLGNIIPNLQYLVLGNNFFEGVLPLSVGQLRNLRYLDLSFNNLSGKVPKKLIMRCTNLDGLVLSNNKFTGEFFSSHFNLSNLNMLEIRNNQFTGSVSNVEFKHPLDVLSVGNNKMTGKLPSWISNVSVMLDMRNNLFEGHFPCEVLIHAEYIDVSHNLLSGALPSCFDQEKTTTYINFEGNKFKGSIPTILFNLSYLLTLNLRDNGLFGSIPDMIGIPSNLVVLLLGNNYLSGSIPKQFCQIRSIRIMDLSNNFLSGRLPFCLHNITYELAGYVGGVQVDSFFWNGHLVFGDYGGISYEYEIDFIIKNRLSSYKKGTVMYMEYMAGFDFSCNKLTGRIPPDLGRLSEINAMNLSHNQLTGSIPESLSNLSNIESLDLSYNNLMGEIPPDLINLNFLEVFSVAHNNLSGRIPDKGQFGTFDHSSYDGNPFLCGRPLEKNCSSVVNTTDKAPARTSSIETESEGKWHEVDFVAFSASFVTTYTIILLTIAAILFINPYWRKRWFNFIEDFIWSCYYFFWDTLHKAKANL